jgi:hypothetical protein
MNTIKKCILITSYVEYAMNGVNIKQWFTSSEVVRVTISDMWPYVHRPRQQVKNSWIFGIAFQTK